MLNPNIHTFGVVRFSMASVNLREIKPAFHKYSLKIIWSLAMYCPHLRKVLDLPLSSATYKYMIKVSH